jgi:hypothetical protein
MSDTIGDLIDKLSIANIRLWHIEDERREFVSRDDEKSLEQAESFLNKVSLVNRERNDLIDQINAALRVLIDKAADKDSKLELTAEDLLGTGKNKFYKSE